MVNSENGENQSDCNNKVTMYATEINTVFNKKYSELFPVICLI